MGSIGDCFDKRVAEAFFSGLQRELLDQHDWNDCDHLATAMFEWVECWYDPHRRHSYNNGLSPLDCETANPACSPTPNPSVSPGDFHLLPSGSAAGAGLIVAVAMATLWRDVC